MTHQIQSTDLQHAVQLLADNGFEGIADAMQIFFSGAGFAVDGLAKTRQRDAVRDS